MIRNMMQLKLDDNSVLQKLEKSVSNPLSDWPPFLKKEPSTMWNVLRSRIEEILKILPFRKIESVTKLKPCPRDGHGAVSGKDNINRKIRTTFFIDYCA